jgi:hypothetical protein
MATVAPGSSVEVQESAVTDRELKTLGLGARSTSDDRWLPAVVEEVSPALALNGALFSVKLGNGRIYGVPAQCWRPVDSGSATPAPGGAHGQVRIVITRRSEDYMAYVDGHREIWGRGSSPQAAVGDLVTAHAQRFGVSGVEWPAASVKEGK